MSGDTEPAAWSIHLHNVDWNAHAHTHAHTHTCSHTHIHSHTHSHTPGPWVSAALPVHAQAHLQFSCKVVSLAVEHRSNINYTFNLWSGQLYVWFVIKQGHRHVSICTQTSVRTRVWHKPIIPAPCEELLTFFLLERGACRRMITMQTMQTLEHMQTCERNAGAHADMWSQCRHLRAHADMWAECRRLSTHADMWTECRHVNGMQTLESTCRNAIIPRTCTCIPKQAHTWASTALRLLPQVSVCCVVPVSNVAHICTHTHAHLFCSLKLSFCTLRRSSKTRAEGRSCGGWLLLGRGGGRAVWLLSGKEKALTLLNKE